MKPEYFLKIYATLKPNQNGCIEFPGKRERAQDSYRTSYKIFHGRIPKRKPYILHSCPGGENPKCVNPEHLSSGTQLQNMRYASLHGTIAHGEGHGNARLTDDDVVAIRNSSGMTQSDLAFEYGVSKSAIRKVLNYRSWRHIA